MLDGISSRLESYMDVLSARQKLVARNIANADTPGYKTQDVDFEAELQRATGGSGAPTIIEARGLVTKNDGNNVSLDREARMLSENDMRFNIASQLVRGQIRHLRSAINEGKNQ
ncbi:MAG: flagellar basal body protein [Acidobacteriota bacterium]